MKEKENRIWKQKVDWIASKGGMALLNTHPDYMQFNGRKMEHEMYSIELFEYFLEYIKQKYPGRYWKALPREITRVL